MQRVKIYNDLLHLTVEWMNADMLNRGMEAPPNIGDMRYEPGDSTRQFTQYTVLVPGILCVVFRLVNQNK
jgi:hypothetical protein